MDTIRMDTNPLSAGGADAAADTVDEQDRVLLVGRRKGNPFPERVFRSAGGREMGLKCLLTHARSLRDKWLYRAAFSHQNRPRNPAAGDSPVTTAADPQIVPRQPASLPALRVADQGVASALESRPLRQHQARLWHTMGIAHRLVRRGRPRVPAGGAPHRRPKDG